MNITDNLIRIKEGKDNIIKSLKNKGVEISDNTLINEIPTIIDNAEIGGGGGSDTPVQPEIPELVQKYEGASVFRIVVPNDNYEFAINLCNDANSATYDVDWGDGALETGLTTDEQHHTYSKSGTYDVNVYNLSKDITIVGGTINSGVKSNYINRVFNNTNDDKYIPFLGIETQNIYICTDILFGDKITSIGDNAFNNYKSLKSVTVSENITSIGNKAFINSGLKYLNFNVINCNDFSDNSYFGTNLVFVKIGDKVQKIPTNFLSTNSLLTSITIPESVTSIGSRAFQNCSSLTSITITEGVTSIGNSAFSKCSSLTSITIPEGVTSIDSYTFQDCSSLTSITIPEGVTSIGSYTFSNNNVLQSITCKAEVPPTIQSNTFQNLGSNIPSGTKKVLRVPEGSDYSTWKSKLSGFTIEYIPLSEL